jgi:hypothetical protein
MKKSKLIQLIKEEINNIMNEDEEKTYIFSYIDAWGGREENEEFWSVEVKGLLKKKQKKKHLKKLEIVQIQEDLLEDLLLIQILNGHVLKNLNNKNKNCKNISYESRKTR